MSLLVLFRWKKVSSMRTIKKLLHNVIFYLCVFILLFSTNYSCKNYPKEKSPGYSSDDIDIVVHDMREIIRKVTENLVYIDDNTADSGINLYDKSREEIYKILGKYGFSEKTTNQEMGSFIYHIKEGDYSGEIFTYDVVTSAKSNIYISQRVNYIFVLMILKENREDVSLFGFIRVDMPGVWTGWQKIWSQYMSTLY